VTDFTPAASWATAGTKIASSELLSLKRKTQETAGLLAKNVLVTGKMGDYLLGNTEVQWLLQYQAGVQALLQAGQQFGQGALDFVDLRWHKSDAGYKPNGGAFTRFQDNKSLIVLPEDEDLPEVLGLALG